MLSNPGESFIGCETDYEEADIVLFGAPMDNTTSYRPGTRFGPKAIRGESYGIETYSPYQQRDLSDIRVCDSGDLELPFGDTVQALAEIERRAALILADHKLPVLLGGEHLVTLGAVRAAFGVYPELCIIHFDAHADLRQHYLGVTLSHACVLRRCWDILGDGKIHQFGVRSGDREEFCFAEEGHVQLHPFNFSGLEQALVAVEGKPVYFTCDLDVLDPGIFPGTGTPEAGGVGFSQLLTAILLVCRRGRVVACDLNELSPPYDPSGIATATACKVLRELLLAL